MKCLSALYANSCKHRVPVGSANRVGSTHMRPHFPGRVAIYESPLTGGQEVADSSWELWVYLRREFRELSDRWIFFLVLFLMGIMPFKPRKEDLGQKEESPLVNGNQSPPLPPPRDLRPFGSSSGVWLTAHCSISSISSAQHSAWQNLGLKPCWMNVEWMLVPACVCQNPWPSLCFLPITVKNCLFTIVYLHSVYANSTLRKTNST